jgi:hypothetical protein
MTATVSRKTLFIFLILLTVAMTPFVAANGSANQSPRDNCVFREQTVFNANYNATTGGLNVVVVNKNGQAISLAHVVSIATPGGQPALDGYTDYQGHAYFTSVLPGYYTIHVSYREFADVTQDATVVANQDITIVVTMYTAPFLGGVLVPTSIVLLVALVMIVFLGVRRRRLVRNIQSGRVGGRRSSHTTSLSQEEIDTLVPTLGVQEPDEAEHSNEFEEPITPRASTNFCPYCGENSRLPVANFCWNCGANLEVRSGITNPRVSESTSIGTEAKRRGALIASAVAGGRQRRTTARMGRCMVCGLELNRSDQIMWCPYCGNASHKTHLLEWLHVKDYCPICHHHMDEKEILNEV